MTIVSSEVSRIVKVRRAPVPTSTLPTRTILATSPAYACWRQLQSSCQTALSRLNTVASLMK